MLLKELRGASSSLGYRSMWKILREKHIILKGMPHCLEFTIAAWVAAMIVWCACMHRVKHRSSSLVTSVVLFQRCIQGTTVISL